MKIGRSGTLAKKPCQCLNSDGFELNHLRDELIMIDCINVGAYNPEENLLRKHELLPIPTHAHENYAYTATQIKPLPYSPSQPLKVFLHQI